MVELPQKPVICQLFFSFSRHFVMQLPLLNTDSVMHGIQCQQTLQKHASL